MRKRETIKETGKNVLLRVKVKPSSDNFKVTKINKWTGLLEIKLSQPAKKGKANEELVKKLGEILNKKIGIKTGRRSREKTLIVYNSSKKEIVKKLNK